MEVLFVFLMDWGLEDARCCWLAGERKRAIEARCRKVGEEGARGVGGLKAWFCDWEWVLACMMALGD